MKLCLMLRYIFIMLMVSVFGVASSSLLNTRNSANRLPVVIDALSDQNGVGPINNKERVKNIGTKKVGETLRFTYMLGDLEYLPKDVDEEKDNKLNAFRFNSINQGIMRSFYNLAREYNHTETSNTRMNENLTGLNPLVNNSSETESAVPDIEFPVPADSKYIKYNGYMVGYEVKDVLDCISKMDKKIWSKEDVCGELAEGLLERDGIEDPNIVYGVCLNALND